MKESIKNVWVILAQSSAIDQNSNTLSLFDILEEIAFQTNGPVPKKMVIPINTQLVSLWERGDAVGKVEFKFKFILRDPKKQILSERESVLKMEEHHKRSRFRAQLQGMPITVPGMYRYEIVSLEPQKTGGKEFIASVSVEVKIDNQSIKSPFSV